MVLAIIWVILMAILIVTLIINHNLDKQTWGLMADWEELCDGLLKDNIELRLQKSGRDKVIFRQSKEIKELKEKQVDLYNNIEFLTNNLSAKKRASLQLNND